MGISVLQPSFARGEMSPNLAARVDQAGYQISLKTCKNFLVMASGGVRNRPGTKYVDTTINNEKVRLIRFKFSIADACVLVFSNLKMSVVRNGAFVPVPIVTNGFFFNGIAGWTALNANSIISWRFPSRSLGVATLAGQTGTAYQLLSGLVPGQSYQVSAVFKNNPVGSNDLGSINYGIFKIGTSAGDDSVLSIQSGVIGALGTPGSAITGSFVATASTHYLSITAPANMSINADDIVVSGQSIGLPPYSIETPYTTADLEQLNYTQSADVMTMVHTSYRPRELKRFANDNWTMTEAAYLPSIAAPASATATSGGGSGATQVWRYQVTAVYDDANSIEESLPATTGNVTTYASLGQATVTWPAVNGATYYNIYKDNSGAGVYGFTGKSATTTFTDNNITATKTDTPPTGLDPFVGAGNYPGAVGYYQQRKVYGGSLNFPQRSYFSRTGVFNNYGYSSPAKDDDAITWTMASTEVNRILHYLPLRQLLTMTSGAEWIIQGATSGLTAKTINGNPQSYNGSGFVPPLVLNDTALYLQGRGQAVSSLNYSLEADGLASEDLTRWSDHLFRDYPVVDWTYQRLPDSIVWAVRQDGVLLGLTYLRTQQVVGWHRHETDGFIESVTCVPEGQEDVVYLVVRRIIQGQTRRYIERMQTRQIPLLAGTATRDVSQAYFVDSGLSYQGWNQTTNQYTLAGGSNWGYPETMTVTSQSGTGFTVSDVGRQIHMRDPATAAVVRLDVVAFVNAGQVQVVPGSVVPVGLRNVPTTKWALALRTFAGLSHLEGKGVAILADGNVVSENSSTNEPVNLVVTGGSVTLPNHAAVAHIGLPYVSDLETLRINIQGQETLNDKHKVVSSVSAIVDETRGIFAGRSFDSKDLFEVKQREFEDYNSPVDLLSGLAKVTIPNDFDGQGQVCIRQVDPLPITVLGIIPELTIAGKK